MEADFMSLVKPSCSDTIADLDFANLLNKDDLPTLVLPTSATVVLIYYKLTQQLIRQYLVQIIYLKKSVTI